MRFGFFHQSPSSFDPQRHSFGPFDVLGRYAIHTLLIIALLLTGLGILVLLFPLVLAVVVAILFFWIALMAAGFAYRIHRSRRYDSPTIVDVRPPDEDLF